MKIYKKILVSSQLFCECHTSAMSLLRRQLHIVQLNAAVSSNRKRLDDLCNTLSSELFDLLRTQFKFYCCAVCAMCKRILLFTILVDRVSWNLIIFLYSCRQRRVHTRSVKLYQLCYWLEYQWCILSQLLERFSGKCRRTDLPASFDRLLRHQLQCAKLCNLSCRSQL
jgi:hypothetical protein